MFLRYLDFTGVGVGGFVGGTGGPAGVPSGVGVPAGVPAGPACMDTFDIVRKRTNLCRAKRN